MDLNELPQSLRERARKLGVSDDELRSALSDDEDSPPEDLSADPGAEQVARFEFKTQPDAPAAPPVAPPPPAPVVRGVQQYKAPIGPLRPPPTPDPMASAAVPTGPLASVLGDQGVRGVYRTFGPPVLTPEDRYKAPEASLKGVIAGLPGLGYNAAVGLGHLPGKMVMGLGQMAQQTAADIGAPSTRVDPWTGKSTVSAPDVYDYAARAVAAPLKIAKGMTYDPIAHWVGKAYNEGLGKTLYENPEAVADVYLAGKGGMEIASRGVGSVKAAGAALKGIVEPSITPAAAPTPQPTLSLPEPKRALGLPSPETVSPPSYGPLLTPEADVPPTPSISVGTSKAIPLEGSARFERGPGASGASSVPYDAQVTAPEGGPATVTGRTLRSSGAVPEGVSEGVSPEYGVGGTYETGLSRGGGREFQQPGTSAPQAPAEPGAQLPGRTVTNIPERTAPAPEGTAQPDVVFEEAGPPVVDKRAVAQPEPVPAPEVAPEVVAEPVPTTIVGRAKAKAARVGRAAGKAAGKAAEVAAPVAGVVKEAAIPVAPEAQPKTRKLVGEDRIIIPKPKAAKATVSSESVKPSGIKGLEDAIAEVENVEAAFDAGSRDPALKARHKELARYIDARRAELGSKTAMADPEPAPQPEGTRPFPKARRDRAARSVTKPPPGLTPEQEHQFWLEQAKAKARPKSAK